LLISFIGKAQQTTDVTEQLTNNDDTVSAIVSPFYQNNRQRYLSKLDSTLFPTGILIDRTAFRKDIHDFNGDDRVKTCDFFIWKQLYNNLAQSCNNSFTIPQYDAFKQYIVSMGRYHSIYILPILNLQFNTIDKKAYIKGDFAQNDSFLVSSGATPASFLTSRMLVTSPFAGRIHGNKALFMIDSSLYISNIPNETIKTVDVDFDDGNGWQNMHWNMSYAVNYGAESRWVMAKLRLTINQMTFATDSLGRMSLQSDSLIERYTHFTFLHTGTRIVPEPTKRIDTTTVDSTGLLQSVNLKDFVEEGVTWNAPPTNIVHYGGTVDRLRTTTYNVNKNMIIPQYITDPNKNDGSQIATGYWIYVVSGSKLTLTWWETNGKKFDYNILFGSGNNSGKLRKPIIVVDGFDPDNTRGYYQTVYAETHNNLTDDYRGLYERMNGSKSPWTNDEAHLLDELTASGYDLLFINWTDGAGDIPTNALYLQQFLQDNEVGPNSPLLRDNQTEEIILVGPSMGGVITRYCLTTMEQAYQEHHVKQWFSYDSPQEGANIPIGMQWSVTYLESSGNSHTGTDKLETTAARQLLLYHYEAFNGHSLQPANHLQAFDSLYSHFHNLQNPYPLLSKNIAISNGGTQKLYPDNTLDEICRFQQSILFLKYMASGYKTHNDSVSHIIFNGSKAFSGYSFDTYNQIGFDNGTGGFTTFLYDFNQDPNNENKPSSDFINNPNYSKSCYVSTASAFGIPITRNNVYKSWDQFDVTQTPFDVIHGTGMPASEEHCKVTQATSVWLQIFLSSDRQFVQKPFRTAVDETESNKCLYTATNSITFCGNNSRFILKAPAFDGSTSGADVNVIAPHIIFSPGFRVENGAHLSANPGTVANGFKSIVETTTPSYSKQTVKSYFTSTEFSDKVYDYSSKNSAIPSERIKIAHKEITVYPNPANNELFIDCADSIAGKMNVTLINVLGVVVLSHVFELSSSIKMIDITSVTPGFYFIKVNYNSKQEGCMVGVKL
jgi:hypothetical protein